MAERTRNRVLLVDDESIIRMAVRKFLTAAGFEIVEAENRATAMSKIRAHRPDAVILDYKLPDGTALDLLPQIRAIDESVAVILLTAHATIDLAVAAMKEGADHFLTKPVELPALLVVLERALATNRALHADLAERTKESRKHLDPFAGTSAAIRASRRTCRRSWPATGGADSGETGTGKGVLAAWLIATAGGGGVVHPTSTAQACRRNCSSPAFRHERGAFTGAVQRSRVCSMWPIAERCSSTRSATSIFRCSPSC